MANVWVLYDQGFLTCDLYRADAIEHVRSTRDEVQISRIGAENRETLLHVSDRPKLPAGFALDLLKTIDTARNDHPDEDTVVAPLLSGETWSWQVHRLAEYQLPD